MTDDTMAAAVKAAAEAVSATGVLGCGCCATYPTPRCACGTTAADLGYDVCPVCDRYAESDYDRDRIVAEAAVTAAAPFLLAPVEAEVQRLSEAFIASEAEVARLRNPDLRIVMGYDLGREEGEREAVAAERTRIAAAIRAERDRCTLGSAMWATFEAAARIAEGETSTIRDANPGNAQDARRIAAVERLLDTAERQHRVVVTVTSVRLALGNADVPMSPDKGHDAMLTIETIEGRFNPAAPKPSADQRPEWLKQAEPNPRIATVALACASSYEWARIAVEALDRYDADHSPASRDAKWIRFHDADLRERIAQAIDQAWATMHDADRNDGGYRDGYLDGLEHAEGIARSVSLTGDTGPMSADDDTEADDHDLCARDYGEAIDKADAAQARIAAALALCAEPEPTKADWREFLYDGKPGVITDDQHAEYNRAWLRERIVSIRRALTDARDDAPTTTTED